MALLPLATDVPVHDPVIVKERGTYYCYSTHGHFYSSLDLHNWKYCGRVFSRLPDWVQKVVPEHNGIDFWAPEVVYRNDVWRFYYAVSSFGKNTSAIGLMENTTLNPASPDYAWRDRGAVLISRESDNFNAIDPAVCKEMTSEGCERDWLLFGSFWGGLYMLSLDKSGLVASSAGTQPVSPLLIASRQLAQNSPQPEPNAIEGGFIVPHGGLYYLFASHDFCCRGTASSYHIVYGVSEHVCGPYIDESGRNMRYDGGTLVRDGFSFERWAGPGHNSVFTDDDGKIYLVYHAYDRTDEGRSKLQIEEITLPFSFV